MSDLGYVARRRWAHALISRSPAPPPSYGSLEWQRLPEGHPAKVASAVIAAECWARAGDTLAEDLAAELESLRHAHKRLEDAEFVARRDAHRRSWRGGRYHPTEAEVAADMAAREAEWIEWTRGEAS